MVRVMTPTSYRLHVTAKKPQIAVLPQKSFYCKGDSISSLLQIMIRHLQDHLVWILATTV
jgi:hypothetical protein